MSHHERRSQVRKTTSLILNLVRYEYLWADGKKIKKPIQVSAEEYANYLMTWVQEIFGDETVFPVNDGKSFVF
jgi:predicted transcriptional regulator